MRAIFSVCVLCLLAAGWLGGQSLPDKQLPDPPSTGLLDAAGILGKGSGAERRVSEMIETLERERGYRVFVIIERSLIASDPNDMAARLQQAWLPDGGGMVVVYESDTRLLGIGRNLDPEEGMVAGKIGVPSYELFRVIGKTLEGIQKEDWEKPEALVESMVTGICKGIEDYFVRKEAPLDSDRSLRLALVTVGALSLLALCGMGLGSLMGKADKRQAETRYFPEIDVPQRLGAPYGGGCGGSGSFGHGRK